MAISSHHRWQILLLLALSGCSRGYDGPERASVTGRVTLDGRAVAVGVIEFVPTSDTIGPNAGAKIIDGVYEIAERKGPFLGQYQVRIRAPGKTGKQTSGGSLQPAGTLIEEVRESIPAKFNEETTLMRDVVSGKNQFDFELESS